MHMVTKTYQLRDGEKLTEFYNRIDWKPLFEFVQRYYGIGVEQLPVPCLKPNGRIEVNWPENLRDKCGLFCHTYHLQGEPRTVCLLYHQPSRLAQPAVLP